MTQRWTAFAAAALIGAAGAAQADFPEEDITFLIPYGPGGGFDTITRKIAPKMSEILGVEVVPTNMPGASGRKAAIEVTRAEPDGHTIMIFNIPGHGLDYIRGEEGGYDINALTWLGQVGQDGYVVLASPDNPDFASMQEAMELDRGIKVSDQGPGATSYMANQIVWNTLGVEPVFITGYKSSQDYTTAVLRGDSDVAMVVGGSAARYNANDDYRILAEFTDAEGMFPDAPDGADVGHPDLNNLGLRRVIAGPPDMDPEVVAKLSDAIMQAVNDPEIQAWAEETGNPMPALGAEDTQAAVSRSLEFHKRYADILE